MKIKITQIILVLFVFITSVSKADKRNVLFIGNSYTFYNGGMQNVIAGIATSMGDTLTHDNSTPGGYTAQQHSTNNTTLNKIAQGGWDYVSIQCQSQEPSFSTGQVLAQTFPYVMRLDSAIQASNTCAETLFFMTWGRIGGDLQNYPNDTYDAMQQRLRNGYTMFTDSANASLSPVGVAWKAMRDNHPTINLYNADGSHPSVNGTYLAACVFYCSMFKKSCAGSMYLPVGVGNADALNMQQIASSVVLDSLENWQASGGIPEANFIFSATIPSPNFIQFTNSSLRAASYSWNFGDGSATNTSASPVHPFPPTGGTYTVCLDATSACGKKDSTCQTIMVGPSSTSSFSATDKIKITQAANQLSIINDFGNCDVNLYDINGRKLKASPLPMGTSKHPLLDLATGIYILQIKKNGKLLKLQKVWNN